MLIVKDNPTGIDIPIQNLQTALHKQLLTTWGLDTDELKASYQAYGRIYRNKKDNQFIAEAYAGNEEYKEVYWNDELSAISWFGQSGVTKFDVRNKVNIHLVFFVDLAKIKPGIQHRADEEVRNDVQRVFNRGLYGATYESTELWLENVLREYPGSRRENRLSKVDMHPVHCFRLNFSLIYSNSNTNCNIPKI